MKNLKVHVYKRHSSTLTLKQRLYVFIGTYEQRYLVPKLLNTRLKVKNDEGPSLELYVTSIAPALDTDDFFESYKCYHVINVDFLINDVKKTTYTLQHHSL